MKISGAALAGGVIALAAQGAQAASKEAVGARSNIIFVLVDDMGVGDLGVFFQNQRAAAADKSKPWQYTPNIDKLSKEGARFTDQYCGAPVCAPSRASLLSGRSQGHTSVRNNQFDKALGDNYTIASVLKAQGYATAAFGKWGLQGKTRGKKRKYDPSNSPDILTIKDEWGWTAQPCNRGFDYFLGYMRHCDGHEHYPKEGVYRHKTQVWLNKTNICDKLDKCYTADLWTAGAKHWITEHVKKNPKQPFFIYLAYDTPHAVLELPPCPYPKGAGLNGGIQWLGEPGHWLNTATGEVDGWTHPDYANATWDNDKNPSTPEVPWPKVYQRYATSVRRIDTAIGDIIQLLKDLKIDDKTLIVFSSDNGPSCESYLPGKKFKPSNYSPEFFRSFAQFDGIKRDCLEGGVRMPVLARWPGYVKPGTVIGTPSMLYDWLPTFSEIAGKPAPAVTDGVSLLPVLTGKGKQRPSTVYVEYSVGGKTPNYQDFVPAHRGRQRGQMQMIRFGDYVGLRYNIKSPDDDFEIYNISKDPQEKNNLARSPEMAELQKRMKARVLQVRMPDKHAGRPYDKEPVPPVENIGKTEPGIAYSVYTGDYPWVPETADMTPEKTGVATTVAPVEDAGSVVKFQGFLDVREGGVYNFQLTADGKASLRIHKALVIDADYHYKSGTAKKGRIILAPGKHPFTLTWLRPSPKATISLEWSKNRDKVKPIPADALSHEISVIP